MKTPTQLERIAVQVEMLKLMQTHRKITEPEWIVIVQKALDLIHMLNLDKNASHPDDWEMQ